MTHLRGGISGIDRTVHRVLGPPVACVVAFWDATGDAQREWRRVYRQSYRAIRSWHFDKRGRDSA